MFGTIEQKNILLYNNMNYFLEVINYWKIKTIFCYSYRLFDIKSFDFATILSKLAEIIAQFSSLIPFHQDLN